MPIASHAPVLIPDLIRLEDSEGYAGGINYRMIHDHPLGLLIVIRVYADMQVGDWIDVFWSGSTPVVSDRLLDAYRGDIPLFIPADKVHQGPDELYFTVTRADGSSGGESERIRLAVVTSSPGGHDPLPGVPGHQNLAAPTVRLPPGGIIDEPAANLGVRVLIGDYANPRPFDRITLSWGGELLDHQVTPAEAQAGEIEIIVDKKMIVAAGDGDDVIVMYRIEDRYINLSSDWSLRSHVRVRVVAPLFDSPRIENPDAAADPYDLILLDQLGDDDLLVTVGAAPDGELKVNDVVTLTWVGTTSTGQRIEITPAPQVVERVPTSLVFIIGNAALRRLVHGRAGFSVERAGSLAGVSDHGFATFHGASPYPLAPQVVDAIDGVLDPDLAATQVVIPGELLERGNMVVLTWLGVHSDGSVMRYSESYIVQGTDAWKPIIVRISSYYIAPLGGGTLAVYYRIYSVSGRLLQSAVTHLIVGHPRQLPAPYTRPAALNGVIDPNELPGRLQLVVAPWPGMRAGQRLFLTWQASSGPNFDTDVDITAPMVGHEVVVSLDPERVEENRDANIVLLYTVTSPDHPSQASRDYLFKIDDREVRLPLPEILEAENGKLDPEDVLEGASVRIEASARFVQGDRVILWIASSAPGGSLQLEHLITPGEEGQPLTLMVAHEVIAASAGVDIFMRYEILRAPDGRLERSQSVFYRVLAGTGPGVLRIMGARHVASITLGSTLPRMLSALHDVQLTPITAEWRYEDSPTWQAGTHWIDDQPEQNLYVRTASETWLCPPANVFGNGGFLVDEGSAAFVVMRDEIQGDAGPEVDMVAWGTGELGGELDSELAALDNVAAISATNYSFAARLRNGNVACWGHEISGGTPALIEGDFVQVRSSATAFVGRESNGNLHAWGYSEIVPVPEPVLQYDDYVNLCGAASAFAALRASGHAVAWGRPDFGGRMLPGQELYDDITHLNSTYGAFTALRENAEGKQVIAWGDARYGGELPDDVARLNNVRNLGAASETAFCILLDSGEVKAWPQRSDGGLLPDDVAGLKNVVEVTATGRAFCARLSDGRVMAWGNEGMGGQLPEAIADRTDILQVTANFWAFAALCRDGSVVAWGREKAGGDTSAVAGKLVDVRAVYPNNNGFAALTGDGRVVTWGVPGGGGDSDGVQQELVGRVSHSRRLMMSN